MTTHAMGTRRRVVTGDDAGSSGRSHAASAFIDVFIPSQTIRQLGVHEADASELCGGESGRQPWSPAYSSLLPANI
jgi:hypothetical protein